MASFEYVVVGGGSAGCVVAGELAAAGKRVLLLEAGPHAEEHPETLLADGYKAAFLNEALMWDRFSVPQPGLGGQRSFVGTGRVLGGSGAVNAMVYTRGAREDWDEWPRGWRWDDVVGDFERLEARLRVRPRPATRWTEACVGAASVCGFERREDLNDGRLSDVIGYESMNFEGPGRRNSYVAFIKDGGSRDNLVVRANARVLGIGFDRERRARSVRFEAASGIETVTVEGEVVLAAGALESPRLLQLSGVGPGAHLRERELEVVVDAPEVGQNLQDHPNVPTFWRWGEQVDCQYPEIYAFYRTNPASPLPPRQSDTCYVFWPAPSAMKEVTQRMLPTKLPEALYESPLKGAIRGAVGAAFGLAPVRSFVDGLFGVIVVLGKPRSRGTVRLASRDPRAPAFVDPAYLRHPEDLRTLVLGVRKARELARAAGLGEAGVTELMPGPFARSDAAIERYVRANVITTYHFAGTCRMGDDERSVVDTDLRLRGVRGVRVADASVIPTTPVSALNAPSMLVGLRAARAILAGR